MLFILNSEHIKKIEKNIYLWKKLNFIHNVVTRILHIFINMRTRKFILKKQFRRDGSWTVVRWSRNWKVEVGGKAAERRERKVCIYF